MTVCIAAICQHFDEGGKPVGTLVLGASDRRVTYGDIEFEPPTTKVLPLTSSVVLMSSANDSALQSEIFRDLQVEVENRVQKEPDNWWRVKEIADRYVHYRNLAKLKRAESEILAPLGLDRNNFIEKIPATHRELLDKIKRDLQNFTLPYLGAIVAGVDMEGGAHIYVIESGDNRNPDVGVSCYDGIGFAAIGSGSWHANSQFMLAKHAWHLSLDQTLGLIYIAKKKAEIAPGVGMATDMFMIGPGLGSYVVVGDHVHKKLADMYKRILKREGQIQKDTKKEMAEYVKEIGKKQKTQVQSVPPPSGDNKTAPK